MDKSTIELLTDTEAMEGVIGILVKSLKIASNELREPVEEFLEWTKEMQIKAVEKYEDAGFCRNDAITMTLDEKFVLVRLMGKLSKDLPE